MKITTSYTVNIKQQAVVKKVNRKDIITGYASVDKRLMKTTAWERKYLFLGFNRRTKRSGNGW